MIKSLNRFVTKNMRLTALLLTTKDPKKIFKKRNCIPTGFPTFVGILMFTYFDINE
jgi:hypothetical protein